ncbi:MAG: extracellular solute-binding protein [Clostridia bacterium]|nr:extracellular solute-binding protein [Clostridia bacterium]
MKRWLCILLTALTMLPLLCGCTSEKNIDSTTQLKQTLPVSTKGTDETIFAEKLIREYTVREVDIALEKSYLKDGYLYVVQNQMLDGSSETTLLAYGDEGTVCAEYTVPTVDKTRFPEYVYMFSGGRFLIVYPSETSEKALFLQMLDVYGNVLAETTTPDFAEKFDPYYPAMNIHTCEDEDGIHILLMDSQNIFYYNESLNFLGKQIFTESLFGGSILYVGNGIYYIGFFTDECIKLDIQSNRYQRCALRLPYRYQEGTIILGGNGSLYIKAAEGIFKYNDGEQMKFIFSLSDSGLISYENMQDIHVINDDTLYYSSTTNENGVSVTHSYFAEMKDIPLGDRKIINLAQIGSFGNYEIAYAISMFNKTNSDYYISYTVLGTYNDEEDEDALIKGLLLNNQYDMIIPQHPGILKKYYDKDIFLDLLPYVGDDIFGCIKEAYSYKGALYQIQPYMYVSAQTALSSTVPGALTWEKLYQMTEDLKEDEVLTNLTSNSISTIRGNGIMEFVDYEHKTTQFDTQEFRDMIQYMETFEQYNNTEIGRIGSDYKKGLMQGLTNGTLMKRVREGGLKLLESELSSPERYAVLKLMYGDHDFSICGFPSMNGGSASIYGLGRISVIANSPVVDGCTAFIQYMLTPEMQLDCAEYLLGDEMPVTKEAFLLWMNGKRFHYFSRIFAEWAESGGEPGIIPLYPEGTTTEFDPNFGGSNGNADRRYRVIELTDEDIDKLYTFFDTCHMKGESDNVIMQIVEEELSYWRGNARSLEETTKIIHSRVWIYLNE